MDHRPAERPLSFAADMLRAVRGGTKTQTRRPTYPQNVQLKSGRLYRPDGREIVCPFGVAGDRLWVRERFAFLDGDRGAVVYSADSVKGRGKLQWQQSRYLPREASRVLLRVVGTRAERLQSISDADARVEGYPADEKLSPIEWFHRLWDRLTMAETLRWDANPWVWVVEFEVIEGALDSSPPQMHQLNLIEQAAVPLAAPSAPPSISVDRSMAVRPTGVRSTGFRSATMDEKRKLAEMLRSPR